MKICFAKFSLNVISSLSVLIGGIVVNIVIWYPGNNIIDLYQISDGDECIDFTTMCSYYYFVSKNTIYSIKNMF